MSKLDFCRVRLICEAGGIAMNSVLRFLYAFAAVAVTAFLSAYFVESGIDLFYDRLDLPTLTPPNAVFAPVWSVLYVLMIFSFYKILNGNDIFAVQRATALFLGQLVLHALWCWLFFSKQSFVQSAVCLLLLIVTVLVMIRRFFQIDRTAARLQYPYLLWLVFALYLNIGVALLNESGL
jgi:tryptophan-rich sensory protein